MGSLFRNSCLLKTFFSQETGVAFSAGFPVLRVVAGECKMKGNLQSIPEKNDFFLSKILKRGYDFDRRTLASLFRSELNRHLVHLNELGSAIRITRIIHRVDADINGIGTSSFRERNRKGKKKNVAARNVCVRNLVLSQRILRNLDRLLCERGS